MAGVKKTSDKIFIEIIRNIHHNADEESVICLAVNKHIYNGLSKNLLDVMIGGQYGNGEN